MADYLTLATALQEGRKKEFANQFIGISPKKVLELTKLGKFFFFEGVNVALEEKHKPDCDLVFFEDQNWPEKDHYLEITLSKYCKISTATLCCRESEENWFHAHSD